MNSVINPARRSAGGAALLLGVTALASLLAAPAAAHGFAGQRFFPATPSTEDPAVADELALPTVTRFSGKTAVSAEYAKRLFGNYGGALAVSDKRKPRSAGDARSRRRMGRQRI